MIVTVTRNPSPLAGVGSVAVLPAAGHDPILSGLQSIGVAFHAVLVAGPVRTNLTVTEPDGSTARRLDGSTARRRRSTGRAPP